MTYCKSRGAGRGRRPRGLAAAGALARRARLRGSERGRQGGPWAAVGKGRPPPWGVLGGQRGSGRGAARGGWRPGWVGRCGGCKEGSKGGLRTAPGLGCAQRWEGNRLAGEGARQPLAGQGERRRENAKEGLGRWGVGGWGWSAPEAEAPSLTLGSQGCPGGWRAGQGGGRPFLCGRTCGVSGPGMKWPVAGR